MFQMIVRLLVNITNIVQNILLSILSVMIEMAMSITFLVKQTVLHIGIVFMFVIIRQRYFQL